MTDHARSLDDLLDGERIAMFVTSDQRARPMTIVERDGSTLWFLTTREADWVARLAQGERVTVAVSDPGDSLYVSLTGTARTTTDRPVLDRLWNPVMKAWFDGREDPDLVAIEVTATDGEYWDGPGTGVGRVLRGLAGVVTGSGDETMGEQGDVTA